MTNCPVAALQSTLIAAFRESDATDEATFGLHGAAHREALDRHLAAYQRLLDVETAISHLTPTSPTGAAIVVNLINAYADKAYCGEPPREEQEKVNRLTTGLLRYLRTIGASVDPELKPYYRAPTASPPPAETLPAWIAAAH